MEIRIKLTFIGLPLTNKHCNKHCLALTKTTKRQRIEAFALFVFQHFSLNGIDNFFRCEINDKVTTILTIVATCSSYKNFCVAKLYNDYFNDIKKNTNKQTEIQNSNPRFNASDVLQNLGSKLTNQNKGKFPERSATFCNVVEFSNFVVKLLSVFLHVIGPLTKKVAFHCSQLTL